MSLLTVASSRSIFDSLDISPNTKQDYLTRLPSFLGFVSRNGVTRDLLLDYKKYLRDRNDLSVSSKNKYLAVARLTLKELYRQGQISVDLSLNIKSFQQSNKHKVEGLNDQEVLCLREHLAKMPNNYKSSRLRAIVALLLNQGLRQIEICRLNVNDCELKSGRIYVTGKGRNDKEPVLLHPSTVEALKIYLTESKLKDGALFISLMGPTKGSRLTVRGLRKIVQDLLLSANIHHRTVHGFRHTFTTKLLKAYRGDLTTVARFTRHKNMDMLIVYNDEINLISNLDRYIKAFD